MAVNSCSQGFPLSICLWTPIRQAPMCPNHNNKFYVIVICPTNQSLFYKLVHPNDLIKQSDLSTAERMKLKKLTQVVPSSPGRGATLQVGSQPRSSRHRLAAGAACRWGRPAPVPARRVTAPARPWGRRIWARPPRGGPRLQQLAAQRCSAQRRDPRGDPRHPPPAASRPDPPHEGIRARPPPAALLLLPCLSPPSCCRPTSRRRQGESEREGIG